MAPQYRGSALAMTEGELERFLRTQPLCRVATIGPDGHPHISTLWFVWDGEALWLNSLIASRRWSHLARDPRVSVVVDDGGADFLLLRGAELRGRAETVRSTRELKASPQAHAVKLMFAEKYPEGRQFRDDGGHGWLRILPTRIASWDFGKLRQSVDVWSAIRKTD